MKNSTSSNNHKNNEKNASIKGIEKIKLLKEERILEYNNNPKKCKFCNTDLDYNHRHNKYCNSSCSAKDTNKNKKGIKHKLSKDGYNNILISNKKRSINKKIENKSLYTTKIENNKEIVIRISYVCECCGNYYIPTKSIQKYCSKSCGRKNKITSEETKQKLRNKTIERINNGKFSGWSNRNIISYPEKFFIEVLNNNSLIYEHNKPIKKKDLGSDENSNYFLDFYFEDKKIDLEIDGKQHKLKERKESDKKRDELLIKNGIKVYRIEWKSINNEKGKEYIKNEIKKFLDYYNSN